MSMLSVSLKKYQLMALILLPLAWIFRNTFFLRQRGGEFYSSVDQLAIIQILIIAIIVLVIITSRPTSLWHDLKGSSGRWWILFYLLGVISFFWSANPDYSAYRALEFLALSVALMLIILNSADEIKAERKLLLLSWTVLVCEVLAQSISEGFSIIGIKSNSYGATAVMIACYCWGETLSAGSGRKIILIVSGVISTLLVLNSLSIASWWAFLIGGSFLAIFSRKKLLFFIFSLLLILLVYTDQDTIDQFIYRQKSGMTFEEMLSGRARLWEDYWFAFKEKPWLGFGFAMASREVGQIYTTNTHNFIFAILVGLGVAGFAVFLIYLVNFVLELIATLKIKGMSAVGLFAAFIASFVNGMSFSFIGESWVPPTYVFVCLFALHLYQYLYHRNYTPSNPI